MRFIVENFGPIESAEIKLKDLNIFIGKNSSGKSYLAYLIWSLLSVEPNWDKLRALFDEFVPNDLIRDAISKDEVLHKKFQEKKEFDFKKYTEELDSIYSNLTDRFKNLIIEVFKRFDEVWGRNLEDMIKDVFLVDNIGELVRTSCEKARIVISNDKGDKKINIEIGDTLKSWIDNKVIRTLEDNLFVTVVGGEPMLLTLSYYEKSEEYTHDEFFVENYQTVGIIPVVFIWVFDDYCPYTTTFIAPDGRTGLIRSMEAYNYALISGKVTINEVDRIFMRDFMSLYPRVKNEEIYRFADFIEKRLDVRYVLGRDQPRYIIKIGDIEMPIQRAPSGYRELAPIVYAMKYKLDKEHVIFVEEPEAHLHPDAQVVITRALTGLSKYCYIVVTTHSITLLDEISNLLKLRSLSNENKKNLGYEDWEGLNPEDVGIFLVRDGKIEELEVHEDGIEESDLDRVIIEIANLHAKVEEEYEHTRRLQAQR
ncbi:hypothetical protein DRP05_09405 [Archaeoglobales archaeon]|nr:MAG: hypothetical protein DRP05_09405 [Archaeoglobales archaeon]